MSRKSPIKLIILGKIGSCYGIRGWLRIFSSTENVESIFNYQPWFVRKANHLRKVKLDRWRRYNQNMIIKLIGINDTNAANLLTNYEIVVYSSQLPLLEEDNYYWKDIIGCKIISTEGYNLGKVINIIETGSNDVLVVQSRLNDTFNIKERLIPFLNGKVIKKVNLSTRIIEVDWSPYFR